MRLPLRRSVLALALLAAPAVRAQEPQLRATVDATRVGVQDQLQLTLTAEGGQLPGETGFPALRNLRVVGGPAVSTQFSFVNGATSQSQSYTWVLQPVSIGHAEVGSIHARLGNTDRTTAPIAIEVVDGSIRPRAAAPDPMNPLGSDPLSADPMAAIRGRIRGSARAEPKIFVRLEPSRTRLHVGEPLLLTLFVYTQTNYTADHFTQPLQLAGFWSEDLPLGAPVPGGEPVSVGGEPYRRFPVLQKLLFPTRAGALPVPAATVRLQLDVGFFDPGASVDRSTEPLSITVDPIPDEPAFSGAVGHFTARAALDRASVAVGEAATLRFIVEGTGNLKWIDRGPDVVIAGAKVYPPQVKSDITASTSGMSGSKTWEYVVVPQAAGALTAPPLTFGYFDPGTGRLESAGTAALSLAVQPAQPGVAGPSVAPAGPGGLALRPDIDVPRTLPALGGRALSVSLGALLALHALLWAGFAMADRKRADRGTTAPRAGVRQALHDLEHAARPGVTKEAAAALIEKALVDVFGFVDDGSAPANPREAEARRILQDVQFIRYAPQLGDYSEKIRDVAARAADLVRRSA